MGDHGDRVLAVCEHPLVQHKVTLLRDVATSTRDFRQLSAEIAGMLTYEATRDLELEPVEVQTPLETTTGLQVSGKKVGVVPILRAGVGMLDGVLSMIPVARVGFLGLYRNEETLQPVPYYQKLPVDLDEREVLLLDPMLATGGSAAHAAGICKELGARRVRLLCIIAAPEGVKTLHDAHPDVIVHAACLDRQLNEIGYILPGLGDAGDRLWGTK
jgi:uracil phosphoribosyltransferase